MEVLADCWYKDVCTNKCSTSCVRYLEMKYLMDNSGIPKNKQIPQTLYTDVDYNEFCKLDDIKNDVLNFVKNGKSLYITSQYTGNGKTSWAIKILLKYFDCIWAGNGFNVRGLFVHTPTLIVQLRNFKNPLPKEYTDNLLNTDIVVWDDIGSTSISDYNNTQLLSYLDSRILSGKSNIYTGNLNKDGLERVLGNRLASRLWNSDYVVTFNGEDRR